MVVLLLGATAAVAVADECSRHFDDRASKRMNEWAHVLYSKNSYYVWMVNAIAIAAADDAAAAAVGIIFKMRLYVVRFWCLF